jgi:hypothetical protein
MGKVVLRINTNKYNINFEIKLKWL